MSKKSKQHDKQFKQNAVQYVKEHPDLSLEECAKNLGIGLSTLSRWRQQFEASDEQKEIARLKRELRDTQDALDVLKKAISILGKE